MTSTILYILYHEDLHAIKIGIGDIAGRRYKQHKSKGWKLVAYWYFQNRRDARYIESIVVQTLQKKHGHYLDKQHMPQHGYTETFDANKVKKRGLIRLVNSSIRKSKKNNS